MYQPTPRFSRSALVLVPLLLASLTHHASAQGLPNRVASGDVDQDSAVLWARAAVEGQLTLEWSTDPTFQSVDGTRTRFVADASVPVRVRASGLQAGTAYYLRATDAGGNSDAGTFRTANRAGVRGGLRFGASGDSRGDNAPYRSVANVPASDLDFFVMLGDTIYADVESDILPGVQQARFLPEFRAKHFEVLSIIDGITGIADLRASTALLATIDDHEVTNDFAGGADPATDPRFDQNGAFINETILYGNGLKAFQEYQPIERRTYPVVGDPRLDGKTKLYRAMRYGDDAAVFVLDARSFRDEELAPADITDPTDVARFILESFDPTRTMLGRAQVDELKGDLLRAQTAGVLWKFVMVPEPIQNLGLAAAEDRFEGYAAERTEILSHIATNGITNVVFVAADIHGTVVNEISYQDVAFGPQNPTGAFEVTTGAIAYDAPFGPTVVELAFALGLIDQATYDLYLLLDRVSQDAFVQQLVDGQLLPLGYDLVGLDGSQVDATLLQGSYAPTHTWGWAEFDIDSTTGVLNVTTWGLDPEDTVGAPFVVSEFEITPQ